MAVAELPQSEGLVQKQQVRQSYWGLVWWRFKKSKVAIFGGLLIVLFYLGCVVIPEFVSPYLLETRSEFTEATPQRIHFIDPEGKFHLRPFVYGYEKKVDLQLRIRTWIEVPELLYPIYFFVHGEPYKLLGLIPMDMHLFGVDTSQYENATIFIAGTDSNGLFFTDRLAGVFLDDRFVSSS
jgi:peptide/nickel transport system permease protein